MTNDSPFTVSLSGPLFPSLTLWVEVSTKGNFAHTIDRPQKAELLEFAFIAGLSAMKMLASRKVASTAEAKCDGYVLSHSLGTLSCQLHQANFMSAQMANRSQNTSNEYNIHIYIYIYMNSLSYSKCGHPCHTPCGPVFGLVDSAGFRTGCGLPPSLPGIWASGGETQFLQFGCDRNNLL